METTQATCVSCGGDVIGATGVGQFYVGEVTRKIHKKGWLINSEEADGTKKDQLKLTILEMKKDHLQKDFKL